MLAASCSSNETSTERLASVFTDAVVARAGQLQEADVDPFGFYGLLLPPV